MQPRIADLVFRVFSIAAVFLCAPLVAGREPTGPVMPCLLEVRAKGPAAAAADRIYRAAEKQAHYLLGKVRPWESDAQMRLVTESRSGEHWIRPNAGTIQGLAFLYRFGPYEEKTVGVPRERLLAEAILPMMRYVTATHTSGSRPTSDGKPWGDAWQSAHWAQMLGVAAWWLWDELPDDLRRGVRRVIAREADRIAATSPPSQVRNDTKSEENAWNSQVLSAAVLLMPDDARRAGWEEAFQKWVLSSYLRASDAKSQTIVDGRPVAAQFTGANIHDDFTLENHGFVHPDYMTAFSLSLGCELGYRMTGRRSPEALLYNVPGIYENLKWFVLPDGGFIYPNGQDWQLFRNADWLCVHVLMAAYAGDVDAWSLAMRSLGALERMQARSPDGNVYLDEEHGGFAADLVLEHGAGQITAALRYQSRANGDFLIRERLTANSAIQTERIATGMIGILNHPNWVYEAGRRTISVDGKSKVVAALSGEAIPADGVRSIAVDSVLQIDSAEPLNARYQAATAFLRARAADELYLNWIDGPRAWQAGEVISEWEATVRCAAETER